MLPATTSLVFVAIPRRTSARVGMRGGILAWAKSAQWLGQCQFSSTHLRLYGSPLLRMECILRMEDGGRGRRNKCRGNAVSNRQLITSDRHEKTFVHVSVLKVIDIFILRRSDSGHPTPSLSFLRDSRFYRYFWPMICL